MESQELMVEQLMVEGSISTSDVSVSSRASGLFVLDNIECTS